MRFRAEKFDDFFIQSNSVTFLYFVELLEHFLKYDYK